MKNKKIAFDLETIPDYNSAPEFNKSSVKIGNLKDPEKIDQKINSAKNEYYSKLGLDIRYNKICYFGWYDGDDTGGLELSENGNERDLLVSAWEILSKYDMFITFNGLQFDIPILKLHSLFNRVYPIVNINTQKYKIGNHIDVRAILSNWDFFAKGDLNFYSEKLLGEKKTDDIDGYLVSHYWEVGMVEEIAKYCQQDAKLTYKLGELVLEYYL